MKQYIQSNCVLDSGVFYTNLSKPAFLFVSDQINLMLKEQKGLVKRPNAKFLIQSNRLINTNRYRILMLPIMNEKVIFILLVDRLHSVNLKIHKVSMELYSFCLHTRMIHQLVFADGKYYQYIACKSIDEFEYFIDGEQLYLYRKSPLFNTYKYRQPAKFIDEVSSSITRIKREPIFVPSNLFERLSMAEFKSTHLRLIKDFNQFKQFFEIRPHPNYSSNDYHYCLYRTGIDPNRRDYFTCYLYVINKNSAPNRGIKTFSSLEELQNSLVYSTDRLYGDSSVSNERVQIGDGLNSATVFLVVNDSTVTPFKDKSLDFSFEQAQFYSVQISTKKTEDNNKIDIGIFQLFKLSDPTSGDIFNNPIPDFLMTGIKDCFVFFERLCVVNHNTVAFSSKSNRFNFFPRSSNTITMDDAFSIPINCKKPIIRAFRQGDKIICLTKLERIEVSFEDGQIDFAHLRISYVKKNDSSSRIHQLDFFNRLMPNLIEDSFLDRSSLKELTEKEVFNRWMLLYHQQQLECYLPKDFSCIVVLPKHGMMIFQEHKGDSLLYVAWYLYDSNIRGKNKFRLIFSKWKFNFHIDFIHAYNDELFLLSSEKKGKNRGVFFYSINLSNSRDPKKSKAPNILDEKSFAVMLKLQLLNRQVPPDLLKQMRFQRISVNSKKVDEWKLSDSSKFYNTKHQYTLKNNSISIFPKGQIADRVISLEAQCDFDIEINSIQYTIVGPEK